MSPDHLTFVKVGGHPDYTMYRSTIYTEYCVLSKAHEDAGSDSYKSVVQYKHFRSAWYAFLDLLDIDYTKGFQCVKCGLNPKTLVMDATVLSFRRELGFWKKENWIFQKIKNVYQKEGLNIIKITNYNPGYFYTLL